jgi:hypothetical protein
VDRDGFEPGNKRSQRADVLSMDLVARRPFSSMQAAALVTAEVVARRDQHSLRLALSHIFRKLFC